MKIVTLVENTSLDADIIAEHGLSQYVEACGRKFLFDMGQTDAFLKNAKTLGVDISAVDFAFLSHGHYDHGGGLKAFLKANDHAPVYVSETAFEAHFNALGKYIGLDIALAAEKRIVPVTEGTVIDNVFTVLNGNANPRRRFHDPQGMTFDCAGVRLLEDFRHEQYLSFSENGKTCLLSGCSHKGVLNLVEWYRPDILIGGFHFMKFDLEGKDRAILETVANELASFQTQYYTCHCTGQAPYDLLKEYLGDRIDYLSGGSVLET